MYNNFYQQPYRAPQPPQYAPQPQAFTPPTIHADIIQVASEAEAEGFGVAAGTSQMMCARDDSAFYVKTAYPNGQYEFIAFDRRPPKEVEKPDYITRQELEAILAQYAMKGASRNDSIREFEQTTADI